MIFRPILNFLTELFLNRKLLLTFTLRDLQRRNLGSFFGLTWVFIQPAVTLAVVWFVFEFGFKVEPKDTEVPFSLWLVSAMIPWFFFSEAVSSSAHSIIDQAQIVKKMVFRVSLLPVVKINSAVLIHLVFLVILFLLAYFQNITPQLRWLWILYFMFCAIIFLLGLSWLTSAIAVFVRDLNQVIAVVTQIGFWVTPIFWELSMVPEKYQFLFKLNPAFYITEGYRYAMCGGSSVHVLDMKLALYFWGLTAVVFITGISIYKKLKPHFAEVL